MARDDLYPLRARRASKTSRRLTHACIVNVGYPTLTSLSRPEMKLDRLREGPQVK